MLLDYRIYSFKQGLAIFKLMLNKLHFALGFFYLKALRYDFLLAYSNTGIEVFNFLAVADGPWDFKYDSEKRQVFLVLGDNEVLNNSHRNLAIWFGEFKCVKPSISGL